MAELCPDDNDQPKPVVEEKPQVVPKIPKIVEQLEHWLNPMSYEEWLKLTTLE